MRAVIAKADLVRIASRAASASNPKGSSPVLKNILLTFGASKVSAAGTDLYVASHDSAPAAVDAPGKIAVSARDVVERARAMPEGEVILSSEPARNSFSLKAGKGKLAYNIGAIPGEEFPEITLATNATTSLAVNASLLTNMLRRVLPSVSVDTTRPNLNSVAISLSPGELTMVATDGHRLTVVSGLVDFNGTEGTRLVPLASARLIARLADSSEGEVFVAISDRDIFVTADSATISVRLVDAQFPEWRKVIPKVDGMARITVKRDDLARSVRAVALSSSEKTGGVRLNMSDNAIGVTSTSHDRGDAADEVGCEYAGPDLAIGVDSKLLIDALAAVDGSDIVLIPSGGPLDPILWEPADGNEAHGVIMPMRLDA